MSIREEIQGLLDRYVASYEAGDAVACASFYLPDGAIFSPYGPAATGPEAIRSLHDEWFRSDEKNKKITVVDAGEQGTLAWCLAEYSADMAGTDNNFEREAGTTLSVFERQADGRWRIRYSSLNTAET